MAHFWKTIGFLTLSVLIFTSLSWTYMYVNHYAPNPHSTSLSNLPTEFPSIWSYFLPTKTTSWFPPAIVFLFQVWLTGGFYGTLIRVNSRTSANLSSFIVDASRSFWRLFVWSFLWNGLYIFTLSLSQVAPSVSIAVLSIVLVLRFVFLFGDISLVAEQQVSIRQALKKSMQALLSGLAPMLPFGVFIAFVSQFALWYSNRVQMEGVLAIGLVYGVVMTWVQHMVVARYLYFASWQNRFESEGLAS